MLSKQPHIRIASALCQSVGSQYAKEAAERFLCGDFKLKMPDPDAYNHWRAFGLDYCIYTYLRKFSGDSVDVQRLTREAYLGFKETEDRLASVNRRLKSGSYAKSRGVGNCISAIQRKVTQILGRFDPMEWVDKCEWGPGATSSLSARDSTPDKKILEPQISVSVRALPFYKWILENDIHAFCARSGVMPEGPYSVLPNNFAIVDSSRLTTVEKSVYERRVIDIQPTANLFLQKGVGSMIRHRLKRYGIDLDDQSRNQWLAKVSQRLQLCTIDLAKASDSVSMSLVSLIFESNDTLREWYFVLNALRTQWTTDGEQMYYLHKFSAMGNGFTFELESLIFYAAIQAVYEVMGCATDISGVYGDDLVVTKHSSRNVITLLVELGFQVNLDKSFTRGRFYESCGRHYFDGVDVTPLYQKEEIRDISSAIRACNRLFRVAIRFGVGDLDSAFQPAWLVARGFVDSFWDRFVHKLRTKGRKAPKFPMIPHWLPDDFGVLSPEPFPVRNGLIRAVRLNITSVKIPGDNAALYSLSLRRRCVVESPFLGFVTVRGVTRVLSTSEFSTTPRLERFPSWF